MQNLDFEGWDSQAHREFPGKLVSAHLSLEILGMETGHAGRTGRARSPLGTRAGRGAPGLYESQRPEDVS